MIQADDCRKQILNARIHMKKKTHCINKELPFVSHAITVQNSNKLGVKNVNKWFEGLIGDHRGTHGDIEDTGTQGDTGGHRGTQGDTGDTGGTGVDCFTEERLSPQCSDHKRLRLQKRRGSLVQHNKQYHRKVLLRSFHLNGHTIGFHPQTQKLKPPCTA